MHLNHEALAVRRVFSWEEYGMYNVVFVIELLYLLLIFWGILGVYGFV